MTDFIRHGACTVCGSSDANAEYENGSRYCFSCTTFTPEITTGRIATQVVDSKSNDFVIGEYQDLPERRISRKTCEMYGYSIGLINQKSCTIGNCYNPKTHELVAQKLRYADKEFPWIGSPQNAGLFGQQLCGKGKRIVITEGFEDAMAVSEIFNNRWPSVSILNGADQKGSGPKKELLRQLEWLNNFEEIVLLFDMDEPGQISAIEAAKALPMGKTYIAHISEKDACDMLKAGKGQELQAAIWNAKPYVPDGLVDKSDLRTNLFKIREKSSITYPFTKLNELTFGLRSKELVTIAGGSGLGKSSLVRQIANHLISQKQKVGFITLEEDAEFTAKCLVGQRINKNGRLLTDLRQYPAASQVIDEVILPNTEWYDDQGGLTKERLKSTIEFMALARDVKWVVYDHITMVDKSSGESMVDALDSTMKTLRSLAQRLDITIFIVTQLAKPQDGLGYNEGREVKLSNIRGSAAIEFNSNLIIAFQGDNRDGNNTREMVILKNRFWGINTGSAGELAYNVETDTLETVFLSNNKGDF